MNALVRKFALGVALAASVVLLSACAGGYVEGGDVGVGVDLGPDYYAPNGYYGGYYGGWDTGYVVGPYGGGDHRFDHGHGGTHAYRPAPTGRAMPGIPTGSRGGHGGSRR
jgi:hypothetical protein